MVTDRDVYISEEIKKRDAEIERLRAALREILGWHDYSNDMHKPIEVRAAYMRARAALEEGMTSPDEREDCTGLEDSSTANPCGREDCEEEDRT